MSAIRKLEKENVMKLLIAAIIALTASGASAQVMSKGSVAKIDEPNGTITIRRSSEGTVGAAGAGATSDFKVQDGLLFNALRYGDRVLFTVETINGAKTITTLQRE
jgi:Cu/Ag efflux protein CusF